MRRIILIVIGLVGLLLLAALSFGQNQNDPKTEYAVPVEVTGYSEKYTVKDSKNDVTLGEFTESNTTIQLVAGTYDLAFSSVGSDSVTTRVAVPVKSGAVVKVSLKPTPTALEALVSIAGIGSVSGARYFANNTWLVGAAGSTSSDVEETYLVVAKFSNGAWETIEAGTYVDTEFLLLEGAPPDLISHIEEIQ